MNLKTFLKENRISQKMLANKLGVKQQEVSRWCCGVYLPRADVLLKLKKELCLSSDEVLDLFNFSENRGNET